MTKAKITDRIAETLLGFNKKECAEITELVFEVMKRVLEREGKLKISGFGNFEVRQKYPRKGRNPQTGEELIITPRKVLSFKTSPLLKKKLNGEPTVAK